MVILVFPSSCPRKVPVARPGKLLCFCDTLLPAEKVHGSWQRIRTLLAIFQLHHTRQPPTWKLMLAELVWHGFCSNPQVCLNLFHQHFLSCMSHVMINVERLHQEGPFHTLIHVLSIPTYRKHAQARVDYGCWVKCFLRKIMRLFIQRLGSLI